MFAIDPTDPLPLYAQLERSIRVSIATGRLRPGDQLPTVRQLAVGLRINANTVAKVYGELERARVLEARRGVGTFVREVGGAAAFDADRWAEMTRLADHFLSAAASLGFAPEEAIGVLETRWQDMKEENSDAI
jgi:GntR family transcriptional regulator